MHREFVRKRRGISYLVFDSLLDERLLHGFTMRLGGVSRSPYDNLNLALHVGDEDAAVLANRQLLADAIGYDAAAVTVGRQVHGTVIREVSSVMAGSGHAALSASLPDTDGLLTTVPGIVLMAHSADCTLLYFYDKKQSCIGLAHAGWRGAVSGMGPAMVAAMRKLGCRSEDICVALSPSIGPCCYQVGENVAESVEEHLRLFTLHIKDGHTYFDLPGYQFLQLQEAGICKENLIRSTYCTNCNPQLFFSYRAAGAVTGRMAGVISMKW